MGNSFHKWTANSHLYQGEIKISMLFFFYQEMGVLGGGGFYRACWAGARSVAVVFFPIILCVPFFPGFSHWAGRRVHSQHKTRYPKQTKFYC